jgi:hypothetical protein
MLAVGSERNCSMRFSNIGDNMPYCTILSHRWSGREENERRERQKERKRERPNYSCIPHQHENGGQPPSFSEHTMQGPD